MPNSTEKQAFRFFHVKSSSQLRMDDISKLLSEYKELPTTFGQDNKIAQ